MRASFSRCLVAICAVLASGESVGAQSIFEERQPPDKVRVQVGTYARFFDSKTIAALYSPYALLAAQAYNDNEAPLERPSVFKEKLGPAAAWLKRQWQPVGQHVGPIPCTERHPCRGIPVGGLAYTVWVKKPECRDAIISFRGTDSKLVDFFVDGVSNFRVLFRWLPVEDQYDQTRRLMAQLSHLYRTDPCFRRAVVNTAIGHSLGAGLAQHAAYAHGKIRTVYAFDPSFVTGITDIDPQTLDRNLKGLTINRVHETGEVLSIPRNIVQSIFLPPPCDPTVRLVRFNTLEGSLFFQHSIDGLAYNIYSQSDSRQLDQRDLAEYKNINKRVPRNACKTGILF